MDKKMAALALGLVLLAVGVYLYSSTGNQNTVLDSVKIEVVAKNGTTVATLAPKTPLSIVAIFGSKSFDVTDYFTLVDSNYYFKITPIVKPTYTASGSVSIKYDVSWDSLTYAGKTITAAKYDANKLVGDPINSFPWTRSITISNPTSGTPVGLTDATILVLITDYLQAPPVGSSYDLKGTVTVTATLYVNGIAQPNALKQTGTVTVTIKNQPDGVLSAIEITFDVGTARQVVVTGW